MDKPLLFYLCIARIALGKNWFINFEVIYRQQSFREPAALIPVEKCVPFPQPISIKQLRPRPLSEP